MKFEEMLQEISSKKGRGARRQYGNDNFWKDTLIFIHKFSIEKTWYFSVLVWANQVSEETGSYTPSIEDMLADDWDII